MRPDNNRVLLSTKGVKDNPALDISGFVATGGADRRPSPGYDIHLAVPVLTHPDERDCIYEPLCLDPPGTSGRFLPLNELMLF